MANSPFDSRGFLHSLRTDRLTGRVFALGPRAGMIANTILLALWLWLYRPVFPYLATIFTRHEFRVNQILLVAILALIWLQMRKGNIRLALERSPHVNRPAILFVAAGSTLFVLAERFLDINTLSASLAGLATYGLLGLWLPHRRWRQGLPAALLIIGALPFGDHMQTFIGYPVRLLTAAIVRAGLAIFGVHSLGVDTILVFESGVSQVDLPCSGVKSLWTGGMFLLAATWIERSPLNRRWFGVGLMFAGLLLAANLLRVGILVVVGEVIGWRLLSEMLHVPLGVLGFVGACAAAVGLLRWAAAARTVPARARNAGRFVAYPNPTDPKDQRRAVWLRPLIAGFVLLLALFYSPRPQEAQASPPVDVTLFLYF